MNKKQTILLLLVCCCCLVAMAVGSDVLPAQYRTKTMLNVRSGPGVKYAKIGVLQQHETVVVNAVKQNKKTRWGQIDYHGRTGYIAMKYVEYAGAVAPVMEQPQEETEMSLTEWLLGILGIVGLLLGGCIVIFVLLLLYSFRDEIAKVLAFIFAFMLAGAIAFGLLFHNAELGATVGFVLAVIVGMKLVMEGAGLEYRNIFLLAYHLAAIFFVIPNKLQHVLTEPWRYIFKSDWVNESVKPYLRLFLNGVQVLIYIAITPLRLYNAISYNLFLHFVTEMYDLLAEVLRPSDDDEGGRSFWRWLVMLPNRVVIYPLYHGAVCLIESLLWTVADTFIPAITLYHGTNLQAAQSIVCSPKRNKYLRETSDWTDGTFVSSRDGWGGCGVYFGSRRKTAMGYAQDERRQKGRTPVMVACRVSTGAVINYSLAPWYIYKETDNGGNHKKLNAFSENRGYSTGEWWNARARYWEFCLFDYQNRYNHPWRIRPIYVLNLETGRAQHIEGGMQHWLFDRVIIRDILWSLCHNYKAVLLRCALYIAVIIAVCFVVHELQCEKVII